MWCQPVVELERRDPDFQQICAMMLVDTTVWKVTLPAEAFVADVKLVSDLSTNGSRQVKWVIFPFLTVEAQSLEFFESQLKIQTSSNRCFRLLQW